MLITATWISRVFPGRLQNLTSVNPVKCFENGTPVSYFKTTFLINSTKQQSLVPDFCQAHSINIGRISQDYPDFMLPDAFK